MNDFAIEREKYVVRLDSRDGSDNGIVLFWKGKLSQFSPR